MRVLFSTIALGSLLSGQTPVRVPVACTVEQVQKLDLSCTADDPCPLYLELADVETVGDRLILAGNIHTSSETLESILLVSDDGGKTWAENHTRVPGGSLTDIQFLDFESGWISGHILHPDARDPFFLLSTDGGKTWRRIPIYSELKTGAIEQFRFTTKTMGVMLIDRGQAGENGLRYELWESMTGGDSWNIKQVDSKPIPFPGTAATVKPLRIRADAASKTYRIERQDGARWITVAAFSVALGDCKPEPPEVKEPPPPETALEAPAPAKPKATAPSLKGKKDR